MAETYGERPRPWVLAVGSYDGTSSELRKALDSLDGVTVDYVETAHNVDQSEYDIAVVVNGSVGIAEQLDLMLFSSHPPDQFVHLDKRYRWFTLSRGLARRTRVPDETPADIRDLAAATLVPWVQDHERPYAVLVPAVANRTDGPQIISGPRLLDAFLVEGTDRAYAIAGRYSRPGDEAQCWSLPCDVDRVADWVQLAFHYFAKAHPERFPNRPTNWTQEPDWMTGAETATTAQICELDIEIRAAMSALEERKSALVDQLTAAREVADAGPRRLLTMQGDDLVEEVEVTLRALGFDVQRPDAARAATKDALLEDLEAIDGEWNTLVEVRGYAKGGGKTQDLQRIERFVAHYVKRKRDFPSARWYVVNHSFAMAPNARPRVLSGAHEDVEMFAEAGGLVIDTRDLFRLRRAVANGRLPAEAARELLKSSKGVLDFPSD
jgi:hypothetical protein